jgi:hypothetical protein
MKHSIKASMRWLPFCLTVLFQFAIGLAIYLTYATQRMGALMAQPEMARCADFGGPDALYLAKVCSNNLLITSMSEPHYLARLLVMGLLLSFVVGVLMARWGGMRSNRVMWFAGLLAALLLYSRGPQLFIPSIALLFGHGLAWTIMQRWRSPRQVKIS